MLLKVIDKHILTIVQCVMKTQIQQNPLRKYLLKHSLNGKTFSAKLAEMRGYRVAPTILSRWLTGRNVPNFPNIALIEKATAHEVTFVDWQNWKSKIA